MAMDYLIGALLLVTALVNALALGAFWVTPGLRTTANRFVINLLIVNLVSCLALSPSLFLHNNEAGRTSSLSSTTTTVLFQLREELFFENRNATTDNMTKSSSSPLQSVLSTSYLASTKNKNNNRNEINCDSKNCKQEEAGDDDVAKILQETSSDNNKILEDTIIITTTTTAAAAAESKEGEAVEEAESVPADLNKEKQQVLIAKINENDEIIYFQNIRFWTLDLTAALGT